MARALLALLLIGCTPPEPPPTDPRLVAAMETVKRRLLAPHSARFRNVRGDSALWCGEVIAMNAAKEYRLRRWAVRGGIALLSPNDSLPVVCH